MLKENQLKELRKKYKLTQSQVAQAVCVDISTISSYESGRRIPDFDMLNRILGVYGLCLDVNVIEKENVSIGADFYSPKNFQELCHLTNDELVYYILATQDISNIGRICEIPVSIARKISIQSLKELLKNFVEHAWHDRISIYTIYLKMLNLHFGIETEALFFIEEVCYLLYEHGITNETLSSAMYMNVIDADFVENRNNSKYYHIRDCEFLDCDKNVIDLGNGLKKININYVTPSNWSMVTYRHIKYGEDFIFGYALK